MSEGFVRPERPKAWGAGGSFRKLSPASKHYILALEAHMDALTLDLTAAKAERDRFEKALQHIAEGKPANANWCFKTARTALRKD